MDFIGMKNKFAILKVSPQCISDISSLIAALWSGAKLGY